MWQFSEQKILLKGLNVNYIDEGKGPIIIFLHNSGGLWQIWHKQLLHFSKTHRVIAFSWPSNGISDEAEEDSTVGFFTSILHQFIEALELDDILLFGNCIGASVAINYSYQQPEKIRQLFLFNICPGNRLARKWVGRAFLHLFEQQRWTRKIANPFIHFLRDKTIWNNIFPSILFGNSVDKNDPLYIALDKNLKQLRQLKDRFKDLYSLNSYNLERYIHAPLQVPASLFWGLENKVTNLAKDGHFIADKLQLELIPIEGGGHLCMYEKGEEVNQLIQEFIADR